MLFLSDGKLPQNLNARGLSADRADCGRQPGDLTDLFLEKEDGKMNVREMRNEALGRRVAEALKSRNMDAWYVKTKEEAVRKALELIPEGSTINMGGSASVR